MMSLEQAYAAMFSFLSGIYSRTRSDEIGALLGSMATLQDGHPADSAIWKDWCAAVDKAMRDAVDPRLSLDNGA